MFWYNTGGLDYSSGRALGYDVCAIFIDAGPSSVTNNTHLRSQYDDGSCLATFDIDCVNAFQHKSEQLAMQLVQWPTALPNTNLTEDSLPGVCESIASGLAAALPPKCEPYFRLDRYHPAGYALTSNYDRTGLFFGSPGPNCSITGTAPSNETFYLVGGFADQEVNADTHEMYDLYGVSNVTPIITVFLPIADATRQRYVFNATSVTRCLRITNFNLGSRIPRRPAEPTPVSFNTRSGRLSGGAIAGIVVGSVATVGAGVSGILIWRRRVKRSRTDAAADASHVSPHEKGMSVVTAEFGDETRRHELDPASHRTPELPDVGSMRPIELDVNGDLRGEDFRQPR